MRFGMRAIGCLGALAIAVGVCEPAEAQECPQFGPQVVEVRGEQRANAGDGNLYCHEATAPGVLTVVVRGLDRDGLDLFIDIVDEYGEPVSGGYSDQDLGGRYDAEQLAVTLARPGSYSVRVSSYGDLGRFWLRASWIAFEGLAEEAETDDTPSGATELRIEEPQNANVDPSRDDLEDWWFFRNDTKSTVTVRVSTDTEFGDLILEMYSPGELREPVEISDQDLDSLGDESISVSVRAGSGFYFLVRPYPGDNEPVDYVIWAQLEFGKRRP